MLRFPASELAISQPLNINLLTDRALLWATVIWEARDKVLFSFEQFQQLFRRVFEYAPEEDDASECLLSLSQGNHQAAEYALEFCMLAAGSR